MEAPARRSRSGHVSSQAELDELDKNQTRRDGDELERCQTRLDGDKLERCQTRLDGDEMERCQGGLDVDELDKCRIELDVDELDKGQTELEGQARVASEAGLASKEAIDLVEQESLPHLAGADSHGHRYPC